MAAIVDQLTFLYSVITITFNIAAVIILNVEHRKSVFRDLKFSSLINQDSPLENRNTLHIAVIP